MKVAIIGGNGQLGSDVAAAFRNAGDIAFPLTHAEIEVADLDSVSASLSALQPDCVVNTSALHNVETCERDPVAAFTVNAIGALNLALVSKNINAVLFHVSTDYVFDGKSPVPYVETDVPRPLNAYGTTKLAGEYFVQNSTPRYFILRTSALYGQAPCRGKGGLNFIELMLKLGRERGKVRVVDSEHVTPTLTTDLAAQIVTLSRRDHYGLYHATAEGSCSWYDFAKEIFRYAGLDVLVEVASPGEFPAKVPRPANSVLENRALKNIGLNRFQRWDVGLHRYLDRVLSLTPAPAI